MICLGDSFLGEKRELRRDGHPVSGARSPGHSVRLPPTDRYGRRAERE